MSEQATLQELKRLREKVDKIEKMLEYIVDSMLPEEEISDEDCEALRQALEEHRKGETTPLKEALRQLQK